MLGFPILYLKGIGNEDNDVPTFWLLLWGLSTLLRPDSPGTWFQEPQTALHAKI